MGNIEKLDKMLPGFFLKRIRQKVINAWCNNFNGKVKEKLLLSPNISILTISGYIYSKGPLLFYINGEKANEINFKL